MRYKITEFAKKLGVSVTALRDWDSKGILVAHRTPGNHRFYTEEHYAEYMEKSKR